MALRTDLDQDLARVLDRVGEQAFELAYIKNSGAYAWGQKLRRSSLIRAAKKLKGSKASVVAIRATGRPGALGGSAKGSEVWLLSVHSAPSEPGIPWDFVDAECFERSPSPTGAYGMCLRSAGGGVARAEAGPGAELRFMSHPWSGVVEVDFAGRTESIDLSSEQTRTVRVRPGQLPLLVVEGEVACVEAPLAPSERASPQQGRTAIDERFLGRVARTKPSVVAIHCPRWLGITSATEKLFDCCYRVPQTADIEPSQLPRAEVIRQASVLVESGVKHIVISGGDQSHQLLARTLKSLAPDITIDVLWHGSYFQLSNDYEWNSLKGWIEAARSGLVRSVCTVKAGMEDFFRSLGIPSHLVLNYVPGEPMVAPELPEDPIHVGLWISSNEPRKTPLIMLSAMGMVGGCRLHTAGMAARGVELAKFLGIGLERLSERPLPQSEMLEAMRSTHVSLYTTFSECCPMLPLESLHQGVPCLTGPSSHLFDDDAWLFSRLVVPFPDRADVIAQFLRRAVDERHEIMARYKHYVQGYNQRAIESVRELVEEGPTLERAASGPVYSIVVEAARQRGSEAARQGQAERSASESLDHSTT
jgi:hypothetical protein